jgi:hypothetical protein
MGAVIGLLMSLMIQMIRLMINLIILPLEIAARSGSRSRRRRRTVRRAPVRPRQYRTVAPMPVRPVTPQAPVYRLNLPPGWPPMPYGFTPQPGWQPDPSWPPPPPGWQVWLPANEAARRLDPRRRRRNLIIVGCVVGGLVVLAAIGNLLPKQSGTLTPSMTVAGVASSAPPKPHTVPAKPLPEDLTFTGQVNGTFTRGLNPRPASTKDPNPSTGGFGPYNATQCTNSKDEWEGDLYGNVGGTKISLRLSIATDGTALKVVGTQPLGTKAGLYPQAELIGASGKYNSSTFQLEGTSLDLEYPVNGSATITVNPDKQSGTMHIALTDGPDNPDVKETITGAWTCGPVPLPKLSTHRSAKPQHSPKPAHSAAGTGGAGSQPTAPAGARPGATALCNDGTYSFSQHHQGTCSHHHGVAQWL